MPSKILKAVKNKQQAGGKFWKPGSSLEQNESQLHSQPQSQQSLRQQSQQQLKKKALNAENDDAIREDSSTTTKSPKLLSKGVMSMKFMARKVEIADEERLEAKKRRKILDSGWSSVDTTAAGASEDASSADQRLVCTVETEDLYASLPGRRSFRGFNNVVERFYQHSMDTQKFGLSKGSAEDDGISNEEMFSRYSDLIGIPEGQK